MKLTTALLLFACLQVSAIGWSQERITLKMNAAELKKVLFAIEKKSDYRFLFSEDAVKGKPRVSIDVVEATVSEVLDKVLSNTGISYKVLGTNLVVLKEGPTAMEIVTQEIRVSGKITSAGGEPLAGVSVIIKGTRTGTTSDVNGNFSLTVPDDAVLVFSSVGYENSEVAVSGQSTIAVTLKLSEKIQDAVVVIGYGSSRKKDLTGSIASVSGSELSKQPVLTATQAVQGKVAGVQVITSGDPNALPIIRIRGTGTMLAGANPLYVVDGVINDDIRNINSADIVSMEILKDASATAIYGVRAGNGVIVITTKKGRVGPPTISYSVNTSISEKVTYDKLQLMNSKERTGVSKEIFERGVFPRIVLLRHFNNHDTRRDDFKNFRKGAVELVDEVLARLVRARGDRSGGGEFWLSEGGGGLQR